MNSVFLMTRYLTDTAGGGREEGPGKEKVKRTLQGATVRCHRHAKQQDILVKLG